MNEEHRHARGRLRPRPQRQARKPASPSPHSLPTSELRPRNDFLLVGEYTDEVESEATTGMSSAPNGTATSREDQGAAPKVSLRRTIGVVKTGTPSVGRARDLPTPRQIFVDRAFDLANLLDGTQDFRWLLTQDGWYSGVLGGNLAVRAVHAEHRRRGRLPTPERICEPWAEAERRAYGRIGALAEPAEMANRA